MRYNKYYQFLKTHKMPVSFKLKNANFPPLPNSTPSKPGSSVSNSLPFTTVSRSFSNKVCSLSL